MKFIIVGLGYFGSSLSMKLTDMGHEVIAIDKDLEKVTQFKDRITHTVALDATSMQSLQTLPLKETDIVLVGIGEDFGASVMAVANLKQLQVKRLIGRAISPLHQTVLEAIGVERIISPEADSAERLARSLNVKGVVDSFDIKGDYNIIEANVPEKYVGKSIGELNFRQRFNVNVLTLIRMQETKNIFGKDYHRPGAIGVVSPETVIEKGDLLVLFGKIKDIERLLA